MPVLTKLPKGERDAPEWQVAAEALLLVAAERDGRMMFSADRDVARARARAAYQYVDALLKEANKAAEGIRSESDSEQSRGQCFLW